MAILVQELALRAWNVSSTISLWERSLGHFSFPGIPDWERPLGKCRLVSLSLGVSRLDTFV